MLYTVYVDSQYGSDSNTGAIDAPVQTLSYAFSQVYEGGIIVLQNGTGGSYGNLAVTKNITIKAAYGASPKIGSLTLLGIQGLIEGLHFESMVTGITVSNLSTGSIIIRECKFNSVETAINVDSVNYISIHRNYFYDFKSAVKISSSEEVCVSSNVFSNGMRSVEVSTVERIDLWRNTIYGAFDLPPVPNPDTNLRIIYKTLNSFDINYKRIQLPGFASEVAGGGAYDVVFNVVNGPSFNYGTDFTVLLSGSIISWNGLQLQQEFAIGDVVRIMYSESGDYESSDAIRVQNIGDENSRIDSNSISSSGVPVSVGVYLNTPLKIQYNNFDDVLVWWSGVAPTGATGMNNIGETAMYRDPINEDFRLQSSSPNIDRGDFNRWDNIYGEIGVSKVDVGGNWRYTASYTGIRQQVSPFDRDLDFDLFHRGATGIQGLTGDIGAYEFNYNETAMGNYVAEYGYDQAYPGTETGPYASPDYGFKKSGTENLYIDTTSVPYYQGETGIYQTVIDNSNYNTRYGRYRSKDIILNSGDLIVGARSKNDIVVIYPSHSSLETGMSYVSPDGNDSWTGTLEAPYRTVNRALQDGSHYVLVEPGYYPSFSGESGINLVGVERFRNVGFSGILYSNIRDGSWTGVGTYTINKDSITGMVAPSDIMGTFSFSSDLDFKIFTTIKSESLTVKLFNANNTIYVKINRDLSVLTYGYTTGGTNYEVNRNISGIYTQDELFTDLKVRILSKSNRFFIYLDNNYFHGSYANILTSGSYTDWMVEFISTGTGIDNISNLSAFSSAIAGATGLSGVVTLKKFFAITGSTGIQG